MVVLIWFWNQDIAMKWNLEVNFSHFRFLHHGRLGSERGKFTSLFVIMFGCVLFQTNIVIPLSYHHKQILWLCHEDVCQINTVTIWNKFNKKMLKLAYHKLEILLYYKHSVKYYDIMSFNCIWAHLDVVGCDCVLYTVFVYKVFKLE